MYNVHVQLTQLVDSVTAGSLTKTSVLMTFQKFICYECCITDECSSDILGTFYTVLCTMYFLHFINLSYILNKLLFSLKLGHCSVSSLVVLTSV